MEVVLISHSERETAEYGFRLGSTLSAPAILLLDGDLGTGKTVFTRGVCRGLACDVRQVRSPSFTLINEYQGKMPVYHIDLYRLVGADDIESIGLEEVWGQPAVVIVEWADRLDFVPQDAWRFHFAHAQDNHRHIRVTFPDGVSRLLIERITSNVDLPRIQ